MPIDQLKELVKNSFTFSCILDKFELQNKGANWKTLKQRLLEENIDFSHFDGKKYKTASSAIISLENIMVENSSYSRGSLKKRLLKEKILENKCYECGQLPFWNGKPLVLHLEHINGVSNDHRLENLNILCGHCHSQTKTFAGRNSKKEVFFVHPKQKRIRKSQVGFYKNPNWRKESRPDQRKINWPPLEELQKLLWEKPTTHLAKQLGVSDKAIEKWAKKYNLTKPPRGYWTKLKLK